MVAKPAAATSEKLAAKEEKDMGTEFRAKFAELTDTRTIYCWHTFSPNKKLPQVAEYRLSC